MSAELKARALRLLALREHSQLELKRKLLRLEPDENIVDAVLARMIETGLQSDQRFAESYIRSRAQRFGAQRIARDLRQRGIADDLAAQAWASTGTDDEMARAVAVWQRKFGSQPQSSSEWAKQARFLQGRGFAPALICKLLKEAVDESAQS